MLQHQERAQERPPERPQERPQERSPFSSFGDSNDEDDRLVSGVIVTGNN